MGILIVECLQSISVASCFIHSWVSLLSDFLFSFFIIYIIMCIVYIVIVNILVYSSLRVWVNKNTFRFMNHYASYPYVYVYSYRGFYDSKWRERFEMTGGHEFVFNVNINTLDDECERLLLSWWEQRWSREQHTINKEVFENYTKIDEESIT